jgi:hypothetical protein
MVRLAGRAILELKSAPGLEDGAKVEGMIEQFYCVLDIISRNNIPESNDAGVSGS